MRYLGDTLEHPTNLVDEAVLVVTGDCGVLVREDMLKPEFRSGTVLELEQLISKLFGGCSVSLVVDFGDRG